MRTIRIYIHTPAESMPEKERIVKALVKPPYPFSVNQVVDLIHDGKEWRTPNGQKWYTEVLEWHYHYEHHHGTR